MAEKSKNFSPGRWKNSPHSRASPVLTSGSAMLYSCSTSGRRVTMPVPLGRKSRPTMLSRTLLLPDDCDPTTTICGRSTGVDPMAWNTSCSRFTVDTAPSMVVSP